MEINYQTYNYGVGADVRWGRAVGGVASPDMGDAGRMLSRAWGPARRPGARHRSAGAGWANERGGGEGGADQG